MTERLYYQDSYLKEFEARIVERWKQKERAAIVLDQTSFYPTSGGQPHDTGQINGVAVLDVCEEGEKIVHLLEKDIEGDSAKCAVDWGRRFDHMQQHTGQHILSQAFVKILQAETIGFHLGEKVSNIDLDMKETREEDLWKTEDLANEIIQKNLPIAIHFVDDKGIKEYSLRKEAVREGKTRIIEIEGFDASSCGGTHLKFTGEVGQIKIRKLEKVGSKIRVDFYCGRRALHDYRWKNNFITEFANRFTTADKELGDSLLKLEEEHKKLKKRHREVKEKLISFEVEELYGNAEVVSGHRIVKKIFADRDIQEMKTLCLLLKEKDKTVSLFGNTAQGALLIFSRSEDVDLNLSTILKKSVEIIGGKGGGRPDFAQGGGTDVSSLEKALRAAYESVLKELP
jgi:alanyl-tRNA synthetase